MVELKTKLDYEAIARLQELAEEEIEVADWGGVVRIRELTAPDKFNLSKLMPTEAQDLEGEPALAALAQIVQRSVLNGDGQLMFSPSDLPMLMAKNHDAIIEVGNAVIRLSGMDAPAKNE